jgi:hypothetical protein
MRPKQSIYIYSLEKQYKKCSNNFQTALVKEQALLLREHGQANVLDCTVGFFQHEAQLLCNIIVLIPPNWREKNNCLYFSFIIFDPSISFSSLCVTAGIRRGGFLPSLLMPWSY